MAVDSAASEKEIPQWPLTRRHRKKKSHNGRRRGHIDKRNLTMVTVCLAMGVVRLMAVETRTRQLETQLWQFHIQTSHQTPEIARTQAQCGSRNLKVAGSID